MEISFTGKRALVTGAGKGIGRTIAIELVKCGAQVVALSRTQSDLDSLKAEHPNMEVSLCDVSDWDKTREAITKLGDFDLLVNNAGIGRIPEPFTEVKMENFDKTIDINVKAALNISQVVAEGMLRREISGSIVNVSSSLSHVAIELSTAYCASKAALDSMTRVMALELGEKNIRVNAVNPTIISTKMTERARGDPELSARLMERIPLHRFGEPLEVAYPVLFLLSDKASMINGVTLPIDGGYLIC